MGRALSTNLVRRWRDWNDESEPALAGSGNLQVNIAAGVFEATRRPRAATKMISLMKLRIQKALCGFVIAIGILNFLAFAITAVRLGGDAINGRSENGHYYFSSHGKTTEVSEAVYNYSRIHVYSVWITHPLAMFAGLILSSLNGQNRAGKQGVSTGNHSGRAPSPFLPTAHW